MTGYCPLYKATEISIKEGMLFYIDTSAKVYPSRRSPEIVYSPTLRDRPLSFLPFLLHTLRHPHDVLPAPFHMTAEAKVRLNVKVPFVPADRHRDADKYELGTRPIL